MTTILNDILKQAAINGTICVKHPDTAGDVGLQLQEGKVHLYNFIYGCITLDVTHLHCLRSSPQETDTKMANQFST